MELTSDSSATRPFLANNAIWGLLAVLGSAAMLFFGTGLHPRWWVTWLAPLPVLLLAPRLGGWQAFGASIIVWFLGGLNMWRYLRNMIEIPVPLVLIFLLIPACIFGLAVLLHRKWIRRGALWKAALGFPAVWVTCEYLNATTSPHSTFGSLSYSQMDCLPVLQVASLAGIWGISFCLFLLPATAAALLSNRGTKAQKRKLAVGVGVFFAIVIAYGSWRLKATPAAVHSARVGLITRGGKGLQELFPQDDETALRLLQIYSGQVSSLFAQGADVIVLPEKIARVSDEGTKQVDALFETTAARTQTNIVVGVDRGTKTRRFNEARMYSPQGALAAVYDKHHMIPGFEAVDQPGTTRTVLNEPSGLWGIQICKDMDFPQLSREYGAERVELLLVPAWDFVLDGWLHGRMAIMRGVESGFTIARVAKQGRLTISDDRGRVLAEENGERSQYATLFGTAPVRHDDTLYMRWGDWFAWANIAGLAVILFWPHKEKGV